MPVTFKILKNLHEALSDVIFNQHGHLVRPFSILIKLTPFFSPPSIAVKRGMSLIIRIVIAPSLRSREGFPIANGRGEFVGLFSTYLYLGNPGMWG